MTSPAGAGEDGSGNGTEDEDGAGGRTLDRRIALDWEEPPTTLFDVDVVVVYRDGHRETVADEHVRIVRDGVVVEGHPVERGRRVRQVEVEWTESEGPFERLVGWLRGVRERVRRRMT